MKCFRIWSEDDKRCEAIWLSYLLTICGCLVWKGRIEEELPQSFFSGKEHEYINVIICSERSARREEYLLWRTSLTNVIFCGVVRENEFINCNFNIHEICEPLDIDCPETLDALMSVLSKVIAADSDERKSIIRLTKLFAGKGNYLTKAIYTITDMFCSRRINYAEYQNAEILIRAVFEVERWIQELANNVDDVLTCAEMFAFVYLKNLVDEGYIKARVRGGYDTSIMLKNANFLLNNYREMEAVHFLKLQILHNSINFNERPDDILRVMENEVPLLYLNKAYSEVGDIYREETNRISELSVIEYYEKINVEDLENYQGVYRAGLVCEGKGTVSFKWYAEALKKYDYVISLIEKVEYSYRMPQEYEYFYKAQYGRIKMSILLDKALNLLTDRKRLFYQELLTKLKDECLECSSKNMFTKIYGKAWQQEIEKLMKEKMGKVKEWIDNLVKEEL